jgi:hypothetical protein
MPSTYELITANTLATSAASVTFSSIPATFTDLVVRWSARADISNATNQIYVKLNGTSGTAYSWTFVRGNGSAAASGNASGVGYWGGNYATGNSGTSNTFGLGELYIPSYTSSTKKPAGFFSTAENNTTTAGDTFIYAIASLADITSAITSIEFTLAGANNFMATSSFYLYGISNA